MTLRKIPVIFLLYLIVFQSLNGIEIQAEMLPKQTDFTPRLEGVITIGHLQNENVDSAKFFMNGNPLDVEKIKTKSISPTNSVTTFRFFLNNQGLGLRLLPAIQVQWNGKSLSSTPSAYQVEKAQGETPFQMRASIQTDGPLYPGQTAKMIYEILFRGSINLLKERLPILGAKGFVKIGSVQITDRAEGNYNVQEIVQLVQAAKPGVYHYGTSTLEGILYQEGSPSKPVKASFPEMTIEIKPFPKENMPPSFNGALGNYTMELQSISPLTTNLGETIKLKMTITGKGPLNTVEAPDIECQPGFSGFFEFSDLPPAVILKENSKAFVIELRPLSSVIGEIPPIVFSFFDPNTETYTTLQSKSFPLKIIPFNPDMNAIQKEYPPQPITKTEEKIDWQTLLKESPSLKLENPILLSKENLQKTSPPLFWYLLLLPFGFIFVYLNDYLHKMWVQSKEKYKSPRSYGILETALKEKNFHLLKQALICRLQETGHIASEVELSASEEPIVIEVRAFIDQLMQTLYSTKKIFSPDEALEQGVSLYDQI